MIASHIDNDIKKGRLVMSDSDKKKLKQKVKQPLFDKLISQGAACVYSGAPLSIKNAWNRFSMDRLDESKPHFTIEGDISNIVFICRMLNTSSTGLNRKKLMETVLTQPLVPISDANRAEVLRKIALI